MPDREPAVGVGLNKGEGRAGNLKFRVACQGADQGAGEHGFTCAEIAVQAEYFSAFQLFCKVFRYAYGVFFTAAVHGNSMVNVPGKCYNKPMMRIVFWVLLVLVLLPFSARAQEIVAEPLCFVLANEAPYKVYGNFNTDFYTKPDGSQARHRSNFRLDEAGATDPEKGYPTDRAEFCSYGPFYPDRMLHLTLRTLVPIFDCKTKIDQGPIVIKGERSDDPNVPTKTWAECFE
jgi:hypothetical protein